MEEKSRLRTAWNNQIPHDFSNKIQTKAIVLVNSGNAFFPHVAARQKIQITLRCAQLMNKEK